MHRNRLPFALSIVLVQAALFALGSPARAQDQDRASEQAAQAARADQDDNAPSQVLESALTLAGPSVGDDEPRSLVVYEYAGQLQDLGMPPAEAALELIDLDEMTAQRVADVIAERAMLAEELVTEHFNLFSQAETVEVSGSGLEKGVFFFQVVRALQPLTDRGSLADEIRPLLPDTAAQEFDALLDEYWDAVGRARVADAESRGERLRLRKAVREARRDQIGKEVELAAERALQSERFVVNYLTDGIDLTDDQRARMQRMITNHMGRTMGEGTDQDTGRLLIEILAHLNETQRDLLIERIKGVQ